LNAHPLAPRLAPASQNPGAPPPSAAVHLTPLGAGVVARATVVIGKEKEMKRIRFALVMSMTLMILVLGSGLAQALPLLKPNWKPNW